MIKKIARLFLVTLITLSSLKGFSQIAATTTAGCAPLVGVGFTGLPGASGVFWNFGDVSFSTLNNPTHTYISPGNYVVTYTAIVSSAPVTQTLMVKVFGKPTPNFSFTLPASHCAPMTVPFTDLSVGSGTTPITSWQWAFGDGGIGNTQNPSYVYTIPGTFNVTLIAKDANGCDSTITKSAIIKVSAQPTVIINSNPSALSSCTVPFSVTFSGSNCATGAPGGGPLTYSWGFGNGQNSAVQNPPPVTYTANGAYTVSLTCTDNNQCSKTVSTTVNLALPKVKVKIKDTVCLYSKVIERDSSDAGFTTWAWGDATPNVTNIPTDTVMHQFNTPGVQTITVTANSGGCLDVKTFTVYVQKVVASFTSTPLAFSCNQPFPASYINTSTGGAITYSWTFFPTNSPPGYATSTATNPTFTLTQGSNSPYTIYTMYKPTVQLIAVSKFGCKDTIQHVYDSIRRITSYFFTDKSEGCGPLTVKFTDTSFSTAPLNNYGWDFGDGSPMVVGPTASIVVHTYTAAGTYSVVHTVTNTAGCTDISFIKWIYVKNPPVPSFSFFPSTVCWNQPVTIVNTTTVAPGDTVNHWHVTSDDGYFSGCVSDPNPSWNFNHTGVHGFTMTAYVHGCAGSTASSSSVTVLGPIARGRYYTRCDSSYKVQFRADLQDCQSGVWNYGDGSPTQTLTGTGSFTTSHTYTASGNYTASITGYNPSTGCSPFTHTMIVTVRKIMASITSPTVACKTIPTVYSSFNSQDVMKGCGIGFTWYVANFPPRVTSLDTINYPISTPGTYSIMLVVRDTNNCSDTARSLINISAVNAAFSISSASVGCMPNYSLITNNTSTSDAPITYSWNFGDPGSGALNTSTVVNAAHNYTSASSPFQVFTITVVATNTNGCTSTATQTLMVNAPQPFVFPSITNSICVNSGLTFNVSNVTGAVNYIWNFNDSSPTQTVTTTAVTHTYSNAGTYTASLTTTDINGCQGKATFPVYVQNYPVPGFFYTNQCNATSTVACSGCAIVFQDTSINPVPGPRNWNLSSGGPVVGTATVGNTYTLPGQYPITLTVTTSFGCLATVSQTLTVLGAEADFFTDKNTICKNSSILFTVKDTNNVFTWAWDFGDGRDTGNVSPVSHYYNFYPPGGTTNASLTYWTSDSACKYSVVYPINIRNVLALFDRNLELTKPDSIHCLGVTDNFPNHSIGQTSYSWDFGDGNTSTTFSPNHTYSNVGTYTVTLYVADTQYGCKDTLRKKMVILPPPTVTIIPQDTCALSPSPFTTIGSPNYSYIWHPGKTLNDSTVANPVATLSTTTMFTVQVTDPDGCTSVLTQSVYIQEPPKPISWDTAIVVGQQINIPGYAGTGFDYVWNPTTYLDCNNCPYPLFTGTVNMTYTALTMDTMGCFSINNTFTIEILPKSSVDVPTAFTPNGDGINDVIYVDGWGIKKLNYFRIYNRWGQLLFESHDINVGWDGTYQGVPQNMETYVWQVEVETYVDKEPLFKTSTFKLIR